MVHLMSFRAYANHIGVHPSSVSRAVARGRLPTVLRDGVHLIDPVAADAVRRARKEDPARRRRSARSGRPSIGRGSAAASTWAK